MSGAVQTGSAAANRAAAKTALGDGSMLFRLYSIMEGFVPADFSLFGLEHYVIVLIATAVVVVLLIILLDRLCRALFGQNTKYITPEEPAMAPSPPGRSPPARTTSFQPIPVAHVPDPAPTRSSPPTGLTQRTVRSTQKTTIRSVTKVKAEPKDDWAIEVEKMTLAELRGALKDRGLSCFGSKAALAAKLTGAGPEDSAVVTTTYNKTTTTQIKPEEEEEEEEEQVYTEASVKKLSLAQLRQELKDRGVANPFGSKDALSKKLVLMSSPNKRKRDETPKSTKRTKR